MINPRVGWQGVEFKYGRARRPPIGVVVRVRYCVGEIMVIS